VPGSTCCTMPVSACSQNAWQCLFSECLAVPVAQCLAVPVAQCLAVPVAQCLAVPVAQCLAVPVAQCLAISGVTRRALAQGLLSECLAVPVAQCGQRARRHCRASRTRWMLSSSSKTSKRWMTLGCGDTVSTILFITRISFSTRAFDTLGPRCFFRVFTAARLPSSFATAF